MAKQAKMKKGSIGKKALAAILAASMVLSSSAFSVLASVTMPDGDITMPDGSEIATASLNEENGIAVASLDTGHKIMLGFKKKDGTLSSAPDKLVYDTNEKHPEVVVYDCADKSHDDINDCKSNEGDGPGQCKLLDNTKTKLYDVFYGNAVNAGTGYVDEDDETDLKNQGGPEDASKFVNAGPYVRVNFSNNVQSGDSNLDKYANLGSYYISFDIKPVHLDDVDVAITELQYAWTYTGGKLHPVMNGISVTLGGKTMNLVEGTDYIAQEAPKPVHADSSHNTNAYDTDLISASKLVNGNTNNPMEDKRVVLIGIASTTDENGKLRTGNFRGILGNEHYDGDKTGAELTVDPYCTTSNCEGLKADGSDTYTVNKYPSAQAKNNDNSIIYHINQKTNSGDIKIDDNIVIRRNVGEKNGATRESFIKILNGNGSGDKGKVYDTRRATTDPEYYMTCDDGSNTADADYTVLFEQTDGSWKADPDPSTGSHRFKITTTGNEDYVKGSSLIGNYTIVNPGRLQRAAEDQFVLKLKGATVDGSGSLTCSEPYNGTDYYPIKWDENTIQIGKEGSSKLQYGIDYKVSSPREEWKNAGTYELELQGLSGIPDETATIKVVITPRNINELADSAGKIDKLQFPNDPAYKEYKKGNETITDKNGKNGTGKAVGTTGKFNIENTKKVDGSPLDDGNETSVVRVVAEQGKHTTSKTPTETIVEITDAGLDTSVGDNGKVTLVEGKDYEFEEKTRTDGTKYVEIKGINNYTTELYGTDDKLVASTYEEDIDMLEKMPLNSDSITAYVDPASWEIKQKGQKIQLSTSNIKMTETDAGQTKTLTEDHFNIKGYEQNGKPISTKDGITKPGKAYVIIDFNENGGYINQKKIEFNVTGADFESAISIDPIPAYELKTGDDVTNYINDVLEDAIVVRYAEDPTHPTFAKSNYDVTIKDPDGEIVAIREAGTWKVPSTEPGNVNGYKDMSISNKNMYEVKLGTYKVIVESTDYRYEGTAETDFVVIGKNIATLKGLKATYQQTWSYTGKAIEPPVTVTADEVTLAAGVDYTVTYSHNVDVGLGLIVVNGAGSYSGFANYTFTIEGIEGTIDVESSQKASLTNGVAVGGKDTLNVVALVDGKQVAENVDYSLKSSDESVVAISADGRTMTYKAKGTATITVTPKGGNVKADPITITVNVTAAAASTVKTPTFTPSNNISKKAKTFTVTTSTVKGATQWQIRYSLKDLTKTTKGSKYVTVKNTTKVKRKVITCNKSKKKYYIRVRAYVPGKGWSKWSPQKSIKSR